MRCVKMLEALALVASAMVAYPGGTSATAVTSNGSLYTGTIEGDSEAYSHKGAEVTQHTVLTGPLGIRAECESRLVLAAESHGPSVTAKGKIQTLAFTNCTNGYKVTVLDSGIPSEPTGSLEVHTSSSHPEFNGALTSSSTTITVHTPLGFNCEYRTNHSSSGHITGSSTTTGTATLDITEATIPLVAHSALCGKHALWSGSLVITTPANLNVH